MAEPLIETDRSLFNDAAILEGPSVSSLSEQDSFNIEAAGADGSVNLDAPVPEFQYVPGSKPSPWSELEKTPEISGLETSEKLRAFDNHASRVDLWMKSQEGYVPSDRAAATDAIRARRTQIASGETIGEQASDLGESFIQSGQVSVAAIPIAIGSQLTEESRDTFYSLSKAATNKAIDTVVNDFVRRDVPSIDTERYNELVAEGFTPTEDPQRRIGKFIDRREKLDAAVDSFKSDLDTGNFPDNPEGFQSWLGEKQNTILSEAQKYNEDDEDYTSNPSRKFSTNLDLVNSLADYTATRNDASFNQIVQKMARSSDREQAEGDWEKAFKEGGGLIGGIREVSIAETGSDESARMFAEGATDPVELGSSAISAVLGGGTAKALASTTRAGRIAKGTTNTVVDMAVEAGTEAFQAKIDDPNASVGEAAATGALLGLAFQLTGAAAGRLSRGRTTPETPVSAPESPQEGVTAPVAESPGVSPAPAPTQIPDAFDDGRVRSVLEEEEFATESDVDAIPPVDPVPAQFPANEAAISSNPSVSDLPENDTQLDLTIANEQQIAPVEAPIDSSIVDEVTNEPVEVAESGPVEVMTSEVDEGLSIRVLRGDDGRATVEKVNTETGVTIPLPGAENGFASTKEALDFVGNTFRTDETGNVIEEAGPEVAGFEETDPLLLLLQAEGMQPVQDNIREIGRNARRREKGFRGIEKDVSNRGDYDSVPLVGDYAGIAKERLQKIYRRGSGNRPDQMAQMAFDRGLISDPSPSALFDGIKSSLGKVGGESTITTGEQAVAASEQRDAQQLSQYEDFQRVIASPYRRGGYIPAGNLREGDVLQVAGQNVTVFERTDDSVGLTSNEWGEVRLGPDDQIGYDAITEQDGIAVSDRESIPDAAVVSREEVTGITARIREAFRSRGIQSEARAVTSREHSVVAKSKAELEAGRRITELFGHRVIGIEDSPGNGFVVPGDNENIYIATDTGRIEFVIATHELVHQMRQNAPELYSDLASELDADLRAYIAEKRPELADSSESVVVEEFLADYISDRSTYPEFWEGLAMRDASLFARVADYVLTFLRDLRKRIISERIGVEQYLRDAAKMNDAILDTLVAYQARKRQKDSGFLEGSIEESLPFADIRFADRPTKPNQQILGQFAGHEDDVQSPEREVIPKVKAAYFDSDIPLNEDSKELAYSVYEDLRDGLIDPAGELDLHAATQAVYGELFLFARKMSVAGDHSLLLRLNMRGNDIAGREATRAARVLNIRAWYTNALDGVIKSVTEAKVKFVEALNPRDGKAAVESIDNLQSAVDSNRIKPEDLTPEQVVEFTKYFDGKRVNLNNARVDNIAKQASGKKKAGGLVTKWAIEADSILTELDNLRFADQRLDEANKKAVLMKLAREQMVSDKRTRSRFLFQLSKIDFPADQASALYDRLAYQYQALLEAKKQDAIDNKGKSDVPTIAEKFIADRDKEVAAIEKLNAKSDRISDRLTGGKKKVKVDPATKAPLDQFVADTIADPDNFNRSSVIKQAIRMGVSPEPAARLTDALESRINSNATKRKRGDKKPISDRAKDIAQRFDNPQDRPGRAVDPLRKLVNSVIKKDSAVTQQSFESQMKALGANRDDTADLWSSLVDERARRENSRGLLRQLRAEKTSQTEAERIIGGLAKSQSDTQSNQPGKPSSQSVVRQAYNDILGFGPVRSRGAFANEVSSVGVDAETANRLYDLAIKERANRQSVSVGMDAQRAIERSVPFIIREILNHPSLHFSGPEARLNMIEKIIRERGGLSPIDAHTAAVGFDSLYVKKKTEADLRILEKTVNDSNAPFFRRQSARSLEDLLKLLSNSVNAGTSTADVADVRLMFQRFETGSLSRDKMTADFVAENVPQGIAEKLSEMAAGGNKKNTSFDKLVKAIRTGALDPNKRILDEVAKDNGWVDLTDTELQDLARLDSLQSQPDLTNFELIRYKTEMIRIYQNSALPVTLIKLWAERIIANTFSGPSTMLIGFNSLTEIVGIAVRDISLAVVGSTVGGSISEVRNLPGWANAAMRTFHYVGHGINDAMVTLRTGDVRNVSAEEITSSVNTLEKNWNKHIETLRNPKSSVLRKTAAVTGLGLDLGKWTLRMLSVVDSFAKGIVGRYVQELELFSRASNRGMSAREIRSLIGTVMNNSERFAEEADLKGFKGSDKRAYIEDKSTMAIYASLNGDPMEVSEILNRAGHEANLMTGMGEVQRGSTPVGGIALAVKGFKNEHPLAGAFFVPALQTPYNVFHRSAWWSPYALLRFAVTAAKTRGFRDWSKSPYQEALNDPVQLILRATETVIGSSVMGIFGNMIYSQLFEEDEEKKWLRINLAGPSARNRAERGAWLADGNRPFAVQWRDIESGGDWQTQGFRKGGWEPFNFGLTLFGAFSQIRHETWIPNDASQAGAWALVVGKEVIGESMFFMRSFTSRGINFDSIGREVGFRLSSVIPLSGLLKTPNRFEDMQERDKGFWDNMTMQAPLVRQMSEDRPALNSLGQPVGFNETSGNYMQSKLNIPFGSVPAAPRNRTTDTPGYDDILILLKDKNSYPSQPEKSSLDNHLKRLSTDDEFYNYVKNRGELIIGGIESRYKQLWLLTPEQADKAIEDITRRATDRAKSMARR